MSSSSNIGTRPSFRSFRRSPDDALILVNMAFVQMVTQQAAGVLRLHYGAGGNNNVDVKVVSVAQLQEMMSP